MENTKLADREIDCLIAEKVMGWELYGNEGFIKTTDEFVDLCEFTPSTERNAAALVLERIGECHPREFWHNLSSIMRVYNPKAPRWRLELACVMATPRQLNNGNYEPGNVRWATKIEQARNKRSSAHVTLNGETKTMSEWSEITGIRIGRISARAKQGKTPEQILAPVLEMTKEDRSRLGREGNSVRWGKLRKTDVEMSVMRAHAER